MEDNILSMDSVVEGINGYEGKTVRQLIEENRGTIFKLIKRGLRFDDEVLMNAHIIKTIRDERTYNVIAEHVKPSSKKVYKKETASYDEIVESLSVIDTYEENEDKKEDIEDETPYDETEQEFDSDNNID